MSALNAFGLRLFAEVEKISRVDVSREFSTSRYFMILCDLVCHCVTRCPGPISLETAACSWNQMSSFTDHRGSSNHHKAAGSICMLIVQSPIWERDCLPICIIDHDTVLTVLWPGVSGHCQCQCQPPGSRVFGQYYKWAQSVSATLIVIHQNSI